MNNNSEKFIRNEDSTLAVVRVAVVTILLLLSLVTSAGSVNGFFHIPYIYYLLAAAYLANAFFLIMISKFNMHLAKVEYIVDLIITSLLVYSTDGMLSPFISVYMLIVISAGVTVSKKLSLSVTALASIMFGFVANLQYYESTPLVQMSRIDGNVMLSTMLTNNLGFFILWKLTSDLSLNLKSAGDKLEENREGFVQLQTFHENIVNSMSGGLITTDLDGSITSFNLAAEKITGYVSTDVVGYKWWRLFDWEEIREIFDNPEGFADSRRIDRSFIKPDNKKLHLGVTASSLKNQNGEPTGVIGIFQDLTHIKKMEEAMKNKERLALIGELAASVAHEIRNPLAALSGSMQILKESIELKGSAEELINIALEESDRLNNIITEFLSYAGSFKLHKQSYNIDRLLGETISLLRNHPDHQDKLLIEDLHTSENDINIDIDRMKQVFLNLILNALQAMSRDGRLNIRTSVEYKDNNKTVMIVLSDTGCGIPEDCIEDIFTPFFTTKETGSGLGLPIAARIIEEHAGKIDVKNIENAGAEFTILLPAA